ncbi:MAG: efflux RND transporter permease subunit [Bacteroidales bacterium]|nr:efflux RND transporter permease subunit [Bacteroidales bacterium]
MKQRVNLIELGMKYHHIIKCFIILMVCIGVFGLLNMPRNEFPDFTIRQGVIVGVMPGATAQEVEEQLATKVENYIFGYQEVNKAKTYSQSTDGQMVMFVELSDDVDDADAFWSKLRHGLEELKTQELPTNVLALVGTNDFGNTSAFLIAISSPTESYRTLENICKDLEAELRKVESVSRIKRSGEQKEQIYVYFNQEKINQYHINLNSILTSFKLQDALTYAGSLDNGEMVLPVHLPTKFLTENDLAEQVVYSDPNGNIIRLKDVARIERKYPDPTSFVLNNGDNALILSLEMQPGNNIDQYGREVTKVINEFCENIPDGVNINIISDQPSVVRDAISNFLKEFLIAVIAVILVTMILLPLRVASVAAVTIPITILITMGIMLMVHIPLNTVSLAGLIVVLGMVVDNAIVVIDNHVEYLDHGADPWKAAWKSTTELIIPIITATLAIIFAFLPMMLFLTGMAGDFIGVFPTTVAIALVISLIMAFFMVPSMCYLFIKKGLHKKEEGENNEPKKKSMLDFVQTYYDKALEFAFKFPKITLLFGVGSIVVAGIIFLSLDQCMFPTMDRKQMAVEIYLPAGTSLQKTEQVADSVYNLLKNDKRVTNIASFIGSSSPRFHDLYAPHLPSKNYAQLLVNTTSNEATLEILDEYSQKYRYAFPEATVRWKQIAMESFPAPIEVRVCGNNINDLKATGAIIDSIVRANVHTTYTRYDWQEPRPYITLNLDKNKTNKLGYTEALISGAMMTGLGGLKIATIWEGDYPIDVVLSKEENLKNDVNDLENLQVPSLLTMQNMPLRSIGQLVPSWEEGMIVRRNGVRTFTVQTDVIRGNTYNKVLHELKPEIAKVQLPKGVTIEYGGEDEVTMPNYIPMFYAMAVTIIVIFFILLFEFKTLRRALLIMSTMLLTLFGSMLGLWLLGYPFGFTSFMAIIALMGITVRNGIILVDYGMHLVTKEGYTYREAAEAAGKRRMRPIFLTSMAASMGVVPMIISKSLLWAPVGTVLSFGLFFGMVLTLFVLPVLYWKSASREKFVDEHPIVSDEDD